MRLQELPSRNREAERHSTWQIGHVRHTGAAWPARGWWAWPWAQLGAGLLHLIRVPELWQLLSNWGHDTHCFSAVPGPKHSQSWCQGCLCTQSTSWNLFHRIVIASNHIYHPLDYDFLHAAFYCYGSALRAHLFSWELLQPASLTSNGPLDVRFKYLPKPVSSDLSSTMLFLFFYLTFYCFVSNKELKQAKNSDNVYLKKEKWRVEGETGFSEWAWAK